MSPGAMWRCTSVRTRRQTARRGRPPGDPTADGPTSRVRRGVASSTRRRPATRTKRAPKRPGPQSGPATRCSRTPALAVRERARAEFDQQRTMRCVIASRRAPDRDGGRARCLRRIERSLADSRSNGGSPETRPAVGCGPNRSLITWEKDCPSRLWRDSSAYASRSIVIVLTAMHLSCTYTGFASTATRPPFAGIWTRPGPVCGLRLRARPSRQFVYSAATLAAAGFLPARAWAADARRGRDGFRARARRGRGRHQDVQGHPLRRQHGGTQPVPPADGSGEVDRRARRVGVWAQRAAA